MLGRERHVERGKQVKLGLQLARMVRAGEKKRGAVLEAGEQEQEQRTVTVSLPSFGGPLLSFASFS